MKDQARAEEARPAQEPLGTLLVRRGLITGEQLEAALAEQEQTGAQLGAIVVARGFVRPETVAQALATQHGGLLKTEYGFATTFGPVAPQAKGPILAPPVSTDPKPGPAGGNGTQPALRTVAADSPAALERIALLEAAVAARDAAIASFNETAEEWKAALEQRDDLLRRLAAERDSASETLQACEATIARLEEALEGAAAGAEDTTEADELRAKLAERDEVLAEVEQVRDKALWQIAELQSAREASLAQLRTAKGELAARDARLHELSTELDAARAQLAQADAQTTEHAPPPSGHLLFFQGADGYEIVERPGPPPEAGDLIDVGGESKLVVLVAVTPIPGARVLCAYLSA
jgi:hypothetical protein